MEKVVNELTKDEKLKIWFEKYHEDGIIPQLSEEEYNNNIKSYKKLTSKKLPYIYDLNHFCKISGASPKQIQFFFVQ